MPTAKITAAPSTTPSGSELPRKTGRNGFSWDATHMATRKATNMAGPADGGRGPFVDPALVGHDEQREPHRQAAGDEGEEPGADGRDRQDDA